MNDADERTPGRRVSFSRMSRMTVEYIVLRQ